MPDGVTPVPRLEVAGEIVAVGDNIEASVLGRRVCALTEGGGYAEYCAVPYGQVLEIPDNISFTQAAAIPATFFTVWANLFQLGHVHKGDTVLIHGGASGIGTTALSICKELGIHTISTVGNDEKQAYLKEFCHIINYKKQEFKK
ncbi:hypothetical protein Pcaca04_00500 [Pectobacterium carotovorum subsp. carotovorum]|nr:hypothetical protein Pcaca04_00500 [Pectobacterium carotovorum subsp. carotovorum]